MSLAYTSHAFTRRMTTLYVSVLCTIALLALLGHIVMQVELQHSMNDAHLVNVAGRQRLLSQELNTTVLEIVMSTSSADRVSHVNALKGILAEWQQVQNGLQHGDAQLGILGKNSSEVDHLFHVIAPRFTTILDAGKQVVTLAAQNRTDGRIAPKDALSSSVQTILAAEPEFLRDMDSIVAQYEREAVQHTTQMQETEFVLFLVTLCVLLFEGMLVFRPTVARIANDITKIMHLEERIAYMTEVQRRNQAHERAFNESLNALVTRTYPIQVLELGRYQVQDEQKRTYLVTAKEHQEEPLLQCECERYERTGTCSHFVAASALHASLLELEYCEVGVHHVV